MSADEAVIRPMAPEDVEALRALAREIWTLHYTPIIGGAQIEYMLEQRYSPEVLRGELARADTRWEVLVVEGVLRGYASTLLDDDARSLKLDKLYVHPACQRYGYGERMLARVLAQARALGRERVVLAVNKHNPSAISAYRKWGFRVAESVVKDIGGGFVMDDYIMVRDV